MGAVSGAAATPVVLQRERTAVALFPLRSKTTPNATQMGPHGQNVGAWWCLRALVQLCSAAVNGLNASGQEEAAVGWQHPFLPRWLEAPWWHWSPLQVSRLKLSGSQFWKPFPKLMGEKSFVRGLTPGGAGTSPLGSVGLGLCGFWQVAPPCSPLGRNPLPAAGTWGASDTKRPSGSFPGRVAKCLADTMGLEESSRN